MWLCLVPSMFMCYHHYYYCHGRRLGQFWSQRDSSCWNGVWDWGQHFKLTYEINNINLLNGWRTLVSSVMNFRVPCNAGNFLTTCKPVSFSRRTLHHGVSKHIEYVTGNRSSRVSNCRSAENLKLETCHFVLGFPVPKSKCWDGSQDSKLPLHSSHVVRPT